VGGCTVSIAHKEFTVVQSDFACNLSANDWKEMELASETLPIHAGTSHA
jgi:hypothetical protein